MYIYIIGKKGSKEKRGKLPYQKWCQQGHRGLQATCQFWPYSKGSCIAPWGCGRRRSCRGWRCGCGRGSWWGVGFGVGRGKVGQGGLQRLWAWRPRERLWLGSCTCLATDSDVFSRMDVGSGHQSHLCQMEMQMLQPPGLEQLSWKPWTTPAPFTLLPWELRTDNQSKPVSLVLLLPWELRTDNQSLFCSRSWVWLDLGSWILVFFHKCGSSLRAFSFTRYFFFF